MGESTIALVPIEERQVQFYGDELTATLVKFGNPEQFLSRFGICSTCEYFGDDPPVQIRRIHRDIVLSGHLQGVAIMATPSENKRLDGACRPL